MAKDYSYALGLGVDFPYQGKVYRISDDLEFGVGAAFERWLKREAMQAARDAAGTDAELLQGLMAKWFQMSAAGDFRLQSETGRTALIRNPDAAVELLFLLLEDGGRKSDQQPEVSRELARKMLNDKEAGPWAMALCLVALGLDPFHAMTSAMGVVLGRLENEAQARVQTTQAALKEEVQKRRAEMPSENSSASSSIAALDYLLIFLN